MLGCRLADIESYTASESQEFQQCLSEQGSYLCSRHCIALSTLVIMSHLETLVAQYTILTNIASFISTLDLLHLAQTSKSIKSYILPSQRVFDVLKRQCICDGHGLKDRQAFEGLYSLRRRHYRWGHERRIWQDEPIEVQVYGAKCDTSDTLPCRKCNVNVCEECRYYPREQPDPRYPERRPHLNAAWQNENLMCLCPPCDDKLEQELKGRFLNELCDCDLFKRWLCNKCRQEEVQFTISYYKDHTAGDWEGYDDEASAPQTNLMVDHQHSRYVSCGC